MMDGHKRSYGSYYAMVFLVNAQTALPVLFKTGGIWYQRGLPKHTAKLKKCDGTKYVLFKPC